MPTQWTKQQILSQLKSGDYWSGLIVTYAFPSSISGIIYSVQGEESSGFRPANSRQQLIINVAIQVWDDLIPQSFQLVASGGSNIEFGYSSSMSDYAHAYYPSYGGSVWFGAGHQDLISPVLSEYGFLAFIHEIGHALGLRHMGSYNGDAITPSPSSYQDSNVLSVMSYFGPRGAAPYVSAEVMQADWTAADGRTYSPQTPMLNDVMAIQDIYGVSATTRTDNTVYGFNTNVTGVMADIYNFTKNKNPILTIFDSGGVDTLDLSGWSTASRIDLTSGSYSSCNDMTNNIVISYSCTIENLICGSGDDYLYGNAVNNRLEGGVGRDYLDGGVGDDTLIGGLGDDTIIGGEGLDTTVLGGAFLSYTFTYNFAAGICYLSALSSGSDAISGVEYFQFSDVTRTLGQLLSGDIVAPTLLSVSPADNATGVSVSSNLVLTFSEAVVAGSGHINIFSSGGTIVRSVNIADTSQVSISGAVVTLNLAADLAGGASYYVGIANGVLKDVAGNVFSGISGADAYNFSTAAALDVAPPTLVSTTPTDNATGVSKSSNIVLKFNESVVAGSGNFVLYNYDGSVARTIAVTDTTQVAFSGTTVTIDLTADLTPGLFYSLGFSSGVVKDLAGNSFLGISGNSAIGFVVASAQPDDYPWSTSTSGVVTVNGSVTNGYIGSADDQDAFKVSLVAGNTYVFSLNRTVDGLPDPYLQLFGPTLALLASDDDSGGSRNSRIQYTASTTGTYVLGAADYAVGMGGYTISATILPDDYLNNTATSGVLPNSGQVTGNIEFATDEDWFRVSLQAGYSYKFELWGADAGGGSLGSGSTSLPYLSLYNSTGSYISSALVGGRGNDPQLTFTASTTGTYFLSVQEFLDAGTGSYTLKMVNVNAVPVGSVLISGTAVQGQLLSATNTVSDADGLGAITYRWWSTSDSGNTYTFISAGPTLTVTEAQVGKRILVQAAYVDGRGTTEAPQSLLTAVIGNVNDAPGGAVIIAGQLRLGQVLTVSNTLTDADGLGAISYAWKANGATVGTGSTYTLTQAEVGTTVTVVASYVDGHGTSEAVSSVATSAVLGLSRGAGRDFGGDGRSDILWRNDNGQVALWTMNGLAKAGDGTVGMVSTDWKLVSVTGDYNGDGKSDLLWRNDNGQVAIWTMNGLAQTGGGIVGNVSTDWKIVSGGGDYNGDGTSDILWRNDNGQLAIWTMNGGIRKGDGVFATISADWKISDAAGDYNGDGKADLLWRNDNGQVAIWTMDGTTQTSGPVFANVGTDWKIASGSGDYNGDGKSDILWRNDSGQLAMWMMNGAAQIGGGIVGNVSTDWKVADGAGDYNGDGKSDVLWRNDNGQVALWIMNGTAQTGSGVFATVGTDWKIAGNPSGTAAIPVVTQDYDGDGKSDILWRNDNGQLAIWTMNGGVRKGDGVFATISADWKISDAAGDYNGDGKADLLWRNDNGQVAIWTMDGTTQTSGPVFANVGTDWKIADGSGDYNGDGKSDVLWRNDNGQVALWTMNGTAQTGGGIVANVSTDWKIADGTGDYNGDGKSDILWRNDNGQVAMWTMDGASITGGGVFATVGTDWKIADGGGDYNGDGKSDLLWRNTSGQVAMWAMNGTAQTSAAIIGSMDNRWSIVDGTNDYNGDGKSDILWRSDTGQVQLWEMNGLDRLAVMDVATVPVDWHIWLPPSLVTPG